jgi:hypothetical protein
MRRATLLAGKHAELSGLCFSIDMRSSPKIGALLLFSMLCGCKTTTQVASLGPDTYKASSRAANGFTRPGVLRERAISAAIEYCGKRHQRPVMSSVQEPPPPFLFGHYPRADVEFYCRDHAPAPMPAPTTSEHST